MRRIWRKAKPKDEKKFRVNQQITAGRVSIIDDNGEKLGERTIQEALAMAEEVGMDLVEVNPKGEFPVVKIMDYGQFKYEKEKKAHKQKLQQKKVETKAIRLSVRISSHDFKFRVDQAVKFLEKKQKLKLELILKGRERQHPEKAEELLNEFVAELNKNENINIVREQDLTKQGGRFTMILINKID